MNLSDKNPEIFIHVNLLPLRVKLNYFGVYEINADSKRRRVITKIDEITLLNFKTFEASQSVISGKLFN